MENTERRIGMIEEREFFKYATYDNDGLINGIRGDAPDYIKADYESYLKEMEEAKRKGIKM